jgi:hypothetical protein
MELITKNTLFFLYQFNAGAYHTKPIPFLNMFIFLLILLTPIKKADGNPCPSTLKPFTFLILLVPT